MLESWRRAMGVRGVRLRALAAMHGQIDDDLKREAHARRGKRGGQEDRGDRNNQASVSLARLRANFSGQPPDRHLWQLCFRSTQHWDAEWLVGLSLEIAVLAIGNLPNHFGTLAVLHVPNRVHDLLGMAL